MRRSDAFTVVGVVGGMLALVLLLPLPGDAASYAELEQRLNRGTAPDTSVLRTLPAPRTPRQHWLRSRVESHPRDVEQHLRAATRAGEDPALIRRCVQDWLELGALIHPRTVDLDGLEEALEHLPPSAPKNRSLWVRYSRLAMSHGEPSRARTALETVQDPSDPSPDGLLARAELHLRSRQLPEARDVLDQFMLRYPDRSRGRYWMLEARYHRDRGSDTGAYLAYHHLRTRHPDSLYSGEAERRMKRLAVSQAFVNRLETGASMQITARPQDSGVSPVPGRYLIQVGSFFDESKARRLRDRLRGRFGKTVVVRTARVEGKRYHRVQVLGFASRSDAEKTVRELKNEGFNGFVRRAAR